MTADASSYADAIVQTIRQPLVVLDEDLVVRSANPAFYRTFGVSPEESLSVPLFELGTGQWNVPSLRRLLEDLLPEDTVVEDYEVEGEFPRIGRRSMLVNARRLELADAGPSILVAIDDVTDRRSAERALEARTRELRRSNDELQQFAHVASHDLQEPLRTLSSYSQLFARRYAGELDEKADTYIGFMVDASTRMQRLIRDLLAYSRVQTQERALEPTDLRECVDEALGRLSALVRESAAEIRIHPLPTLPADRAQMVQLFQNLLGNALKYRGEGTLHLDVSAHERDEDWLFAVRDDGIGIEPQYFDRIFGLFQRLQSRRDSDGTGIGLPLCRRIVERHGGRLWVESIPGEGSTFLFTLLEETDGRV